jgi:hypothetical protein
MIREIKIFRYPLRIYSESGRRVKTMRKTSILFVLMMVWILSIPSTASAASHPLDAAVHRVVIANRTGAEVILVLDGIDMSAVYRLTVPAGAARSFTVREGTYRQRSYACGAFAAGALNVARQLKLVFTPCPGIASNPGAPGSEKIHLVDSPSGIAWLYQYQSSPWRAGLSGAAASGFCQLTAQGEITIYSRPSTEASVFSVQPDGFVIQLGARTSGGWLGFDPGVAQAANIGSFRLRWIPPDSQTLTGSCAALPVVWGPPPGICFDMPMGPTSVYAAPELTSAILATLQVGEFAAVNGLDPSGDWAQIDLGPGNTGSNIVGWVEASTLNVNGPCGDPPVITP